MKETKTLKNLEIGWTIIGVLNVLFSMTDFNYFKTMLAFAVLLLPLLFLEQLKEDPEKFIIFNNNSNTTEVEMSYTSWYKTIWAIIAFLIFVPPLGIYLMYKNKKEWNSIIKAFATGFSILVVISMIAAGNGSSTDNQLMQVLLRLLPQQPNRLSSRHLLLFQLLHQHLQLHQLPNQQQNRQYQPLR